MLSCLLCKVPITPFVTWTLCCVLFSSLFLVVVVVMWLHWGMLCEVHRDCTGSYILSQQNITILLDFCVTSIMSLLQSSKLVYIMKVYMVVLLLLVYFFVELRY